MKIELNADDMGHILGSLTFSSDVLRRAAESYKKEGQMEEYERNIKYVDKLIDLRRRLGDKTVK